MRIGRAPGTHLLGRIHARALFQWQTNDVSAWKRTRPSKLALRVRMRPTWRSLNANLLGRFRLQTLVRRHSVRFARRTRLGAFFRRFRSPKPSLQNQFTRAGSRAGDSTHAEPLQGSANRIAASMQTIFPGKEGLDLLDRSPYLPSTRRRL